MTDTAHRVDHTDEVIGRVSIAYGALLESERATRAVVETQNWPDAAHEAVRVRLTGCVQEVVASVHNGGHISAELMPRLFEPFQSGVGRRTRAEGLGLGLYIVQQIIQSHGGEVQVSSTPEAGTSFEIRLPRHARD